ncbi:hypothetical protein, partial [Escherichia coli]|uniref:hypothetical protein n=1 Tax=Escherichia coli TaxID=562 RepID=UPI001BD62D12
MEMVFVWKQNYILVDEYFFFCCTWIVNSASKKISQASKGRFHEQQFIKQVRDAGIKASPIDAHANYQCDCV